MMLWQRTLHSAQKAYQVQLHRQLFPPHFDNLEYKFQNDLKPLAPVDHAAVYAYLCIPRGTCSVQVQFQENCLTSVGSSYGF